MKAADICRVLTELNIAHYPDACNPDYTIHLAEGWKHDGTLLENDDPETDPTWTLRSLGGFDLSPTWSISSEDDLRLWVKQEFHQSSWTNYNKE